MDKFSQFIVKEALKDVELTTDEVRMFNAICSGKGLTPRRVYNEAYGITKLYMDKKNSPEEMMKLSDTIRKLEKVAAMAELDDCFSQGKYDAACDNFSKSYPTLLMDVMRITPLFKED